MSFDDTTIRQAYEFAEACRRATSCDAVTIIMAKRGTGESQTVQVKTIRHDADPLKMAIALGDAMMVSLQELLGDNADLLIRPRDGGEIISATEWVGASRSETVKVRR